MGITVPTMFIPHEIALYLSGGVSLRAESTSRYMLEAGRHFRLAEICRGPSCSTVGLAGVLTSGCPSSSPLGLSFNHTF